MKIELFIFVQIFGIIFGIQNETFVGKRVKRWGNYGNWNGNYGPYGGGGGGGAPPPNNNVAIGYPTAYGLGGMGPRNGDPNPAPKFVVRCINGGAHIGQCRLDEDAICIALGGTCINSQCCTTPFYGLMTTSTTTQQPLIIDGDAFRPKMQQSSESSEERRKSNKSEEQEEPEVIEEEITESPSPTAPVEEEEKLKEIDELSRLLEFGKRNGLSTDSPIYAIFAGLFGITSATPLPPTKEEWIRETIPEQTMEPTEKPIPSTTPKSPITTTSPRVIPVTFTPPANSVETSSSSEETDGEDGEDYTKRLCDDGSHAIGPCNDDGSCPLDHTCQKNSICCFNFASAAKYYLQQN